MLFKKLENIGEQVWGKDNEFTFKNSEFQLHSGLRCLKTAEYTTQKQKSYGLKMCLSLIPRDYIENKYFIYKFTFPVAGVSPCWQGSLTLDNKKGVLLSNLAECMSGPINKKNRLRVSDLFSFMSPKYLS